MDSVLLYCGLVPLIVIALFMLARRSSRKHEREALEELETSPFAPLIRLASANAARAMADVDRLGPQHFSVGEGCFEACVRRGLMIGGRGDALSIDCGIEIAIVHADNRNFRFPLAAITITEEADWSTMQSDEFRQLDEGRQAAVAAMMHRAFSDFLGATPHALSPVERDLAPLALTVPAARPEMPPEDADLLRRVSAFVALLEGGARHVDDADLRARLTALTGAARAIADLLAADPGRAALATDFADHALPKAHGIVAAYLDLARQPDLSAEERTGLDGVAALIGQLPETFSAHLRRIRGAEIAKLADAAQAFAMVSTQVDRVPVSAA